MANAYYTLIPTYTIDKVPITSDNELRNAYLSDGAVLVERSAEDGTTLERHEHPALSEIFHLHCLRLVK